MTTTLAAIERGSFAGHETFPLRYPWLRKAVHIVEKEPRIFQDEDAMVRLGVGKNMVRSIRHWGTACGVLEQNPAATDGAISVHDTAGLRQLLVHRMPELLDVLRPWYEGRDALERRDADA